MRVGLGIDVNRLPREIRPRRSSVCNFAGNESGAVIPGIFQLRKEGVAETLALRGVALVWA
jgi:hypothetical protein